MATLQEQIAQAKAAGYSDADIAQHLSQKSDLAPKIKTAMDAGYKPEEIIAHLGGVPDKTQQKYAAEAARYAAQPSAGEQGAHDFAMAIPNALAGAVRGAGSIGATFMRILPNAIGGDTAQENSDRRAAMDAGLQSMGAQPDSMAYKAGKLGGEIAGTAGAGGVLANSVRAVAPAAIAASPRLVALANAIETGGMRAGSTPGAANMLTRIAGGAITGGAAAGLIDPSSAGTGAVVGAALPPALSGLGKLSGYAGRSLNALAQPFTENGQNAIAGKILNKFAEGGPTAMNAAPLVPGSSPTLAEATGNAGIARLQSAARDIRPNAFADREATNAAARNSAFDKVAGDPSQLAYYKADRSQVAGELYDAALNRPPEPLTPYIKGQVTQLLKRPSIDQASRQAQKLAMERGEKPAATGSLKALHDVKTALDDKISVAVREGKGGEAKALQATKDKLLDVMEKLSPEYAQARATYAEMSKPVNAMEALQGLKLTDARGNMTLSKVQNAISGLEKMRSAPGVNPAKSVTDEQLGVLNSIRDDLLRQSNLNAGKSAGSNTFQNIATDNILSTMIPGKLGGYVVGKAGGVLGQVGKLAYSGPNEAIRNKLADLMLDPAAAQMAMSPATPQIGLARAKLNALADRSAPLLYRSAPALSSSR